MMSGSKMLITEQSLKFKLPFGMIISGPTSSGKTTFLIKLLANFQDLIDPVPADILYCYGEYHDYVPHMQRGGVRTFAGVPSEEQIAECNRPLLLILDDLMLSTSEKYLADLFTKKSHHQNIGVVFLTQNLFEKNVKIARNNSQYIVLMRAPNAALQIRNIGVQLFPKQLDYFLHTYSLATKPSYGYLLLDLHAASLPVLRLRTNIFPNDNEKIVFISKNA